MDSGRDFLLASFVTSTWGQWEHSWHQRTPMAAARRPERTDGLPIERHGLLAVLDLSDGKWIWQMPLDSPAGFVFVDDFLLVASQQGSRVHSFSPNLTQRLPISHPLMNDLHSVSRTERGILITSSGTDALLELSLAGQLIWGWFATEHGYCLDPAGRRRRIARSRDYRDVLIRTGDQATHCNSATTVTGSDNTPRILLLLFHQGEVVEIEYATGKHRVVLDGLINPHSLRHLGDGGWCLTSSGANAIIKLSPNYWIESIIEADFDWPQDALWIEDREVIIADANNSRIVRWDLLASAPSDEYVFDSDWKIYQIEFVNRNWVDLVKDRPEPLVDFGVADE